MARLAGVASGPLSRWTSLAICVATLWCALSGCGGDQGAVAGRSETRPDQEIDGFTLTQTREGQPVWSLRAENALVYEDADRIEMTDLRTDFFDDEGGTRSTLTADRGVLKRRTSDMEVNGNVVVYAADGTVLTTERLTWDERTGKIESDLPVRVTRGKDVMTGVGVEADPDLRNIRVKSDFKAYVRTEEGTLVEEE
jgi:LPS export ABC transporter protein LptC